MTQMFDRLALFKKKKQVLLKSRWTDLLHKEHLILVSTFEFSFVLISSKIAISFYEARDVCVC